MSIAVPLALPQQPTDVPKYAPTGRTESVVAPWRGAQGDAVILTFHELERVTGHLRFDPATLSPQEQDAAQAPGHGRLRGLVAVPESYFRLALQGEQTRLHVSIGGVKVTLHPLGGPRAEEPRAFVVAGVYNGEPDVTNL